MSVCVQAHTHTVYSVSMLCVCRSGIFQSNIPILSVKSIILNVSLWLKKLRVTAAKTASVFTCTLSIMISQSPQNCTHQAKKSWLFWPSLVKQIWLVDPMACFIIRSNHNTVNVQHNTNLIIPLTCR